MPILTQRPARPFGATHRQLLLGVLLAIVVSACVSTKVERKDWSHYDGPGAEYFLKEEYPFPHVDDPLEPINRICAWGHYGLLRFIGAPLAAIYRVIIPEVVRAHIEKVNDNLRYPTRVISNLLQAKWHESGVETARFAINTTIGIGGLFDPASKMDLRPYPEDFGQAFADWGWRDSTYMYLPLFGPSTVRDGLGEIPNAYTNIASYLPDPSDTKLIGAVPIALRANKASDEIEDVLRYSETNYDAYEIARTLYVLDRSVDVTDFSWVGDKSGPTQTLETVFLTFEDKSFPQLGGTRYVQLARTGRKLPYTIWLQPKPAPIVYLIPGFGGHRLGNASLGLAEIVYHTGCSVVTLSSPSNWEFIVNAASVALPGYAPVDALDLHRAITAIDADLSVRHPGQFTRKHLAGISMGAQEVLFIAAREQEAKAEGLLPFDVYIALDPPVNLEYGMQQLDRFYNAPLTFPADERAKRVDEIFGKVLYLSNGDLEPGAPLPFTRLESEFLIGVSFRIDLQFVLMQTQALHDMGVLQTKRSALYRAPAFREASEYSFMEYMYAFLLPYYAKQDREITFDEAGARRLFERSDLRSIADGLAANDHVLVFANENDFLLRPDDIAWLRGVLGERAHIFPAGGHLGNLHRKAIQELIESAVRRKAAETSGAH